MRLRISPFSAAVWLAGIAFFLIPLGATMEFSLRTAHGHGFGVYGTILGDPQFWSTLRLSVQLAAETIGLSLLLLVPTAYWVHLRMPRLRPVVTFLCVLPFVVPPIVLIVGLLGVYRRETWYVSTPQFLVPGYVILSLPYVWFALDAGLRGIDVHTLSEAAESLGAGPIRTLVYVILPGLRAAVLAGALLTLAIVLGEFTMASLSLFNTFPTYVAYIGQTYATEAAALAIISIGLLWGAMLALALATRGRRARTL